MKALQFLKLVGITNPVKQNDIQKQWVFNILALSVIINTSSFFVEKFY